MWDFLCTFAPYFGKLCTYEKDIIRISRQFDLYRRIRRNGDSGTDR